jgi:hypothetical protein
VAVIALLMLAFTGCGRSDAATMVSGEFGAALQVGDLSRGHFGSEWGFRSESRPTELFGSLRLDGGPGSAALCVAGRHTLDRGDWLAWEDCLTVRAEVPLSPHLLAYGGWERRHRIGDSRFVAGAKFVFGRSPND